MRGPEIFNKAVYTSDTYEGLFGRQNKIGLVQTQGGRMGRKSDDERNEVYVCMDVDV